MPILLWIVLPCAIWSACLSPALVLEEKRQEVKEAKARHRDQRLSLWQQGPGSVFPVQASIFTRSRCPFRG